MPGRGVALSLVVSLLLLSSQASQAVVSPGHPHGRSGWPPIGNPPRGPMAGIRDSMPSADATPGIVRAEATAVVADSLPGVDAQCTDFRSGLALAIRAQHLLASGDIAPEWNPDPARFCLGAAQGVAAKAIGDGAGGAIVVWVDTRMGDGDIYAQRFCGPDSIAPGWPEDGVAVCAARGSQYGTAVTPDGAGGVIVAWEDHRAGGASHVYAQRVTSAGEAVWTPDGVLVCPGRAAQKVPAIAADGTGGALIVWQDGVGDARDLHLQHLSSAGTPVAGAGDCGTALVTAPGAQLNPAMVADGQGGAVLVWEDRREEVAGLHALRLDAQGQAVVGWPAQGAPISTAAGRQRWSVVVGDGSQGAIVVWSDSVGVRVQRVTVAGAMAWSPGGVLVHALDGQFAQPAVASDSSGGAIVAWEDPRNGTGDIYAQHVTGTGAVAWAEGGVPVCIAAGEQYSVSLTPDGAGGALATWVDDRVEAAAVYLASRVARIAAAVKLEAVEVGPGRATLTWRTSAADGRAFRFKRRLGEGEWEVLGELTPQAEGLLVGEDRTVPAGSQAQYGLAVALSDMEELQLAAVSVLIPLPKPLALRFARCEEEGRVVRVALTLETDDAARLELFDVAGRRVMSREVGTLGAGDHEVRLPLPGYARAGVYFLRLRQNRVTRTDRVTVLR